MPPRSTQPGPALPLPWSGQCKGTLLQQVLEKTSIESLAALGGLVLIIDMMATQAVEITVDNQAPRIDPSDSVDLAQASALETEAQKLLDRAKQTKDNIPLGLFWTCQARQEATCG